MINSALTLNSFQGKAVHLDPFGYQLGRDLASLVTGDVRKPDWLFENALEEKILENLEPPGSNYTIKFQLGGEEKSLWIDRILFSPSLMHADIAFVRDSGKIINEMVENEFPNASDHSPVETTIRNE